ncbi:hypothetical protein [Bosea lupini]|uniref:hypothetical protein n=1 Tax=Bosea lupini TaxID=1036779 RepID=UPI001430DA06|nr:hypothetical protein [Bosea lupini]
MRHLALVAGRFEHPVGLGALGRIGLGRPYQLLCDQLADLDIEQVGLSRELAIFGEPGPDTLVPMVGSAIRDLAALGAIRRPDLLGVGPLRPAHFDLVLQRIDKNGFRLLAFLAALRRLAGNFLRILEVGLRLGERLGCLDLEGDAFRRERLGQCAVGAGDRRAVLRVGGVDRELGGRFVGFGAGLDSAAFGRALRGTGAGDFRMDPLAIRLNPVAAA